MYIRDLLGSIDHASFAGHADTRIAGVRSDSRQVRTGDLFVAVSGSDLDASRFVPDAVARGASAVICTELAAVPGGVAAILVKDTRKAAWQAARAFHGFPESALKAVGVTGTNGKTTSAFVSASVLNAAGMPCGMLGTVEYLVGGQKTRSKLTTPGPVELYELLARMRDAGDKWVIMEVSSHALDQERMGGIEYDGAIFTNLTRDHLDYHKTMENYAVAKAKLFSRLKPDGVAAVNFSDPHGEYMAGKVRGRVIPFGLGLKGPVQLDDVRLGPDDTDVMMMYGGRRLKIRSRLVGRFNAFNILGVASLAWGLGVKPEELKAGIENMPPVPGRLERVAPIRPRVYVDYAHTDDALANALKALAELPHQRLIVVFGCGGDRDRGKRPLMGRAAVDGADRVYVTSDNPRSEDPDAIIAEIVAGIPPDASISVEPDREKAIAAAIAEAGEEDIVLVAGKGHEDYQILSGETIHFDDREVAREALRKRS